MFKHFESKIIYGTVYCFMWLPTLLIPEIAEGGLRLLHEHPIHHLDGSDVWPSFLAFLQNGAILCYVKYSQLFFNVACFQRELDECECFWGNISLINWITCTLSQHMFVEVTCWDCWGNRKNQLIFFHVIRIMLNAVLLNATLLPMV